LIVELDDRKLVGRAGHEAEKGLMLNVRHDPSEPLRLDRGARPFNPSAGISMVMVLSLPVAQQSKPYILIADKIWPRRWLLGSITPWFRHPFAAMAELVDALA
jgi:hypothetical protein